MREMYLRGCEKVDTALVRRCYRGKEEGLKMWVGR